MQITFGQLTTVPATYTKILLAVAPAAGLASSGYSGGPFTPVGVTYTLTNSGGSSLDWVASKTANWLTLTATSGTLAAGTSTNVTLSVSASANTLSARRVGAARGGIESTGTNIQLPTSNAEH